MASAVVEIDPNEEFVRVFISATKTLDSVLWIPRNTVPGSLYLSKLRQDKTGVIYGTLAKTQVSSGLKTTQNEMKILNRNKAKQRSVTIDKKTYINPEGFVRAEYSPG